MNPLQILMIAGAGYLLYQYFMAPAPAETEQGQVASGATDENGVPVGSQLKEQAQTQLTVSLAEKIRAFASTNQANFHQWNWWTSRMLGVPDTGLPPEAFGVDGNAIISVEQYVQILGGTFPGSPVGGMSGILGPITITNLRMQDRGLGGSGPTGFEKLSTTFRRIN
ncbi:MAG: hypothetical protein L0Y56_22375 [Nitrospira sp.]|nr:hypothetical protein [Nitrospira sp.]